MTAAIATPSTAHHQSCMKRDMSMTSRVKAGRSAPKFWNMFSNCGTTKTSSRMVTSTATTSTAVG